MLLLISDEEKEDWKNRVMEYKRKIDNGEFTINDIPDIVEDYNITQDTDFSNNQIYML